MLKYNGFKEWESLPTIRMSNINTNELIDEGLLIWFPGPQSYTGEDLAEFHVVEGPIPLTRSKNFTFS